MIAAIAAMLLAGAPGPLIDPGLAFGARLRNAAVEAQALQGSLDGAWTLRDRAGHALYLLEIVDLPQGVEPLQAAWRDPASPALGPVASILRSNGRLTLAFVTDSGPVKLNLREIHGQWRGWMTADGERRAVRLTRP